ncbi:hypothetical protein IFU40_05815 [Microbacterium sp. CFBP 13617]|uniref:hypothetical protein n=1 Tax=Microbacterium sp. CFBP 13617 TaxID=2774035 RepID=UPI00177B6612|nr:hypothetical protein [Microbacterium sp. CFBP 13617]MBD8218150.1 hypothetical protein [Microbacterium sp. CFBP 13617]
MILLTAAIAFVPGAAHAAENHACIAVPGRAGSDLAVNVGKYPTEKPDGYRTVDGVPEPYYRVTLGKVLHIPTRISNTGTCYFWVYRGNFVTMGADVFGIPGSSTYVAGRGDGVWGSAVGVPTWDPNPDRNHPYTRRSESLAQNIYPGDYSKRLWPLTVDRLPRNGVYYSVKIRYDGRVSDPPLDRTAHSERFWVIGE